MKVIDARRWVYTITAFSLRKRAARLKPDEVAANATPRDARKAAREMERLATALERKLERLKVAA